MLLARITLLVLMSLSCGKKHEEIPTVNNLDGVKAKAALYISLQPKVEDIGGLFHSECDVVGFASLCKAGGGCGTADLFAAESKEEPGRWYRDSTHTCFPGGTKAEDSNDMAIMRLVYFAASGNKDAAMRMRTYLENHSWVLGRNDGSGEGVSATQFAYFSTLIDWTGGTTLTVPPESGDSTVSVALPGYRGHLQALNVIFKWKVYSKLSDLDLKILKDLKDRQPRNALYQALYHKFTDGVQDDAIAVLNDERLFPTDRLPDSEGRCEEYIFQRDDGSDWQPCPAEGKIHSGADLLFTVWVLGS